MVVIVFAALLLAYAPPGSAPCGVIQGGPAEGLCFGPVIAKAEGGFEIRSLVLSPNPEPALATDIDGIVRALLESHKNQRPISRTLLAPNATSIFCAQGDDGTACLQPKPLKGWPLKAGYRPAAPHLMADRSVRVAWIKGGKIAYLSVITLSDGKVAGIQTMPAEMPYHP